jgi:hypothetical protein
MKPRFVVHKDGEWVKPIMKGWLLKCCDCGLVHRVNFKVIRLKRGNHVRLQAFRLPKRKSKTTQ